MTYIDEKKRRVSSETGYLTDEVLSRPNLKVAIHAHVTKILFDIKGNEKRAIGVEFANSETGPRFRALARKEVIISCVPLPSHNISCFEFFRSGGAVHSPHVRHTFLPMSILKSD